MKSPIDTIYEQVESERLLQIALVRLNARVLGFTVGCLASIGLFAATLILLLKGGPEVGKHLNLLGHYFPFYSVSWFGLVLALLYGWLAGFVTGYVISRIYNLVMRVRTGAPGYL